MMQLEEEILSTQCTFILQRRDLLMNKRDSLALYLCGTYSHKTGTRPPSCQLLENRLNIHNNHNKLDTWGFRTLSDINMERWNHLAVCDNLSAINNLTRTKNGAKWNHLAVLSAVSFISVISVQSPDLSQTHWLS